jgi:signal transduction histidine kinase
MVSKYHFRQSLVLPLTLKIAMTSIILCIVTFTIVYQAMLDDSQAEIVRVIDTDIAGLVDSYSAEGMDGMVRRINDRLALNPEQGERPLYSVASTRDNRMLAGNITRWPVIDAQSSQVAQMAVAGQPAGLVRATVLKGGIKLLVGRSTADRDARLRTTFEIFVIAMLVIGLAALGLGFSTAIALRRRIADIFLVLNAVESGNLAARAPTVRTKDEISTLAHHVNHMLARVERLIAAHRAVTDQTAHETRTPLALLDAELRLAVQLNHQPDVAPVLDRARARIKQLLALLDALLDIAAAQALHGDTANLRPVDLSELAREIAELYAASAEDAGMEIKADIADNVSIMGDRVQLTRLLINLLDNAFKYANTGKLIWLQVAPGPIVSVMDRGPGIPAGDHDKVFERFRRLGGNAQTGSGLGLSLVKAIAERHGLVVVIEDGNPGSRFVVRPVYEK